MELQKRKIVRLKDYDYSSERAYFITICTFNKQKYFLNNTFTSEIVRLLTDYCKKELFKVYCYCFMPDHLHLLINPSESRISISRFIGGFKSLSTRKAWDFGISKKLWQSRFYDHVLRKNESIEKVGHYILNNPIRKNMAVKYEDYPYCGIIDSW